MVSTVNKVEFPTDEVERARAILDGLGVSYQVGKVATGNRVKSRFCAKAGPYFIPETWAPV